MGEPTYRSFSGSIKPKSVNFFFLYFFIFWRPSSPGTPSRNKGSPIEGEFQCCMEEEEKKGGVSQPQRKKEKRISTFSYIT
jgi:hypothetical protein